MSREIRIEGPYVTVESRDLATGTTAKEMPGIDTKGELQSVSEGQLFLKKYQGTTWKIVGDRIDYEKVRVAFGLARDINTTFGAPEQVQSGHQYSAKLVLNLPDGLSAVGSINSQSLTYPQAQPDDVWRPLDGSTLERVMYANTDNHNELLMATIGVTNAAHNSLMGIAFFTRRLNVIPNMPENKEGKSSIPPATSSDITTPPSKLPEPEAPPNHIHL